MKGLLSPKKYRGNRNDQPENKEQPANNEVNVGERSNLNNEAVIMEGLKTPTKKAHSKVSNVYVRRSFIVLTCSFRHQL